MRSNIRGILIFVLAFLLGKAAVLPPMPEIPTLADKPRRASVVHCKFEFPPAAAEEKRPSFTIELRRLDPDFEIEERIIPYEEGGPKSTDIELTLGESIERQLIVINSPAKQEFKVEMQFETSMAIGDEGPHIDLLDWKHYTSPWRTINPGVGGVNDNKYYVPELIEPEFTRFPSATTNELVAALRKSGAGKRWIDHARTCTGPNSGPCYVSTSRISIRISVKQNTGWKTAHTLNFSIPMGC